MHPSPAADRLPPQGIVLLVALSLCWGINWPIMKIVLTEVPPLYFRGACLMLGGLGLLTISRLKGERIRIHRSEWKRLLLLTLFNVTLWNAIVIFALLHMSSGRAALVGYTMPLWSTLLAVPLLKEPLTPYRILGLALGISGVIVLMSSDFSTFAAFPIGPLLMLLAALSWAIGVVLFKRFPMRIPLVALTGWSMLIGGCPMFLLALATENAALKIPSFWPSFGLFYNIIISFMFCYWAWNRIMQMVPVSVSSLSSLAVPLVGVISGVIILNEAIGVREILGTVLILSAVATVSIRR